MPKISAGILLYRKRPAGVEVLLVHPGGPFWRKKDEAAWSIPKGLAEDGEDLGAAARREFLEETGAVVSGEFIDLGAHRQPGGKTVVAFACEGDFDPARLSSNMFAMEWPPRSGRTTEFPEVDRAGWFFHRRGAGESDQRTKGQFLAALARDAWHGGGHGRPRTPLGHGRGPLARPSRRHFPSHASCLRRDPALRAPFVRRIVSLDAACIAERQTGGQFA